MTVEHLGRYLLGFRIWVFALLLLGISIFRSGIHWPDFPAPGEAYWLSAENWPEGNAWASSWSWLLVPKFLGISTSASWSLLYAFIACLTLVGITLILLRLPNRGARALVLLALCASPIVPRMLNDPLGYDRITLLGAILIAASRSWWGILVGAIIFASGNSEVAIVGSLCLLLLSLAPSFKSARRKALITFCVASATSLIILLLKSRSSLEGESRWSELGLHAVESFKLHSPGIPLLIFSFYAGAWILCLWAISRSVSNWERFVVLTSLVLIPGLVCLITLDGTRVFLATAALPFLLTVICLTQRQDLVNCAPDETGVRNEATASWGPMIGLSFLFFVLTPSLFIGPYEYDSLIPLQYLFGYL